VQDTQDHLPVIDQVSIPGALFQRMYSNL
jgi:hypothetical protein